MPFTEEQIQRAAPERNLGYYANFLDNNHYYGDYEALANTLTGLTGTHYDPSQVQEALADPVNAQYRNLYRDNNGYMSGTLRNYNENNRSREAIQAAPTAYDMLQGQIGQVFSPEQIMNRINSDLTYPNYTQDELANLLSENAIGYDQSTFDPSTYGSTYDPFNPSHTDIFSQSQPTTYNPFSQSQPAAGILDTVRNFTTTNDGIFRLGL